MKGKLLIIGCGLAALLFFISPVQAEANPVVERLNIGGGSINITTEGTAIQNGQAYAFSMDKGLTLTGSSDLYGVTLQYGAGSKKAIPLTFENLSINTSKADLCAFSILESASVAITLAPGTNNTLISSDFFAGLQVQNLGGQSGSVRILGTGSLTAVGGKGSSGIGGADNVAHWYGTGGNITIEGGTISATGGSEGAGIGGARKGDGGNINILGGTVTAIGGDQAAGIGGGHFGLKGNVTLGTDSVSATPGTGGDAIGNGAEHEKRDEGAAMLEVNMGSSTPSPTPPSQPTPSPVPETSTVQDAAECETPKGSSALFIGVIVGVLVIFSGGGLYYYRKKRKAPKDTDDSDTL